MSDVKGSKEGSLGKNPEQGQPPKSKKNPARRGGGSFKGCRS